MESQNIPQMIWIVGEKKCTTTNLKSEKNEQGGAGLNRVGQDKLKKQKKRSKWDRIRRWFNG